MVSCFWIFVFISLNGPEVKASACNVRDLGSIPGKIPWRRKWRLTSVFLPGESHGWRSLVGYSPQGHKESDMTKRLHFHFQSHNKPFVESLFLTRGQALSLWSGSTKSRTLDYQKTNPAAKSLQSCLTLCDPIDSSPPGSPVPGILQARTLEWVAISFSNA